LEREEKRKRKEKKKENTLMSSVLQFSSAPEDHSASAALNRLSYLL
jgi:hypothetical protein